MKNRGPRIALVLLVVTAQAAAAYTLWTMERQRTASREAARTFDRKTRELLVSLADLRASEQAYVAAGQGEAFWIGKVASLVPSIRGRIAELRGGGVSPATGQALDEAAGRLDVFLKLDEQARVYVASDQKLMASDLVFGDSAETTISCGTHVVEAQTSETAAAAGIEARLTVRELFALGGAAAFGLVGLLLLFPRQPVETEADPMVKVVSAPQLASAAAPAEPRMEPLPDLGALAGLCSDFSRITDPARLPLLVERAAVLLDASGIIIWVGNPATNTLQPVLSHGYPEQALARIGDLAADADNATAEVFRSGREVTVPAGNHMNGAIVVPMLTPAGCAGVLAAEIRRGGEASTATRAMALIVASQLASLVAPPRAAP